ncbi:MAG: hypothetical protein M0Z87_04075 [Actinomycetota bacterium]|nr:hypothetical protein [Actinomycetota bacterium]
MDPKQTSEKTVREILAERARRHRAPVPADPLPRPAPLPPMSQYLSVKRLGQLLPLPPSGHGPSRTPGKARVWKLLDTAVGGVLTRRHEREDQVLAALADATAELGTRIDDLASNFDRLASLLDQRLALLAARLDQPTEPPATTLD